ncbi:hypothetical protein ACVWXO_001825 [Bradyrhizobium sp. LM2.7]
MISSTASSKRPAVGGFLFGSFYFGLLYSRRNSSYNQSDKSILQIKTALNVTVDAIVELVSP